MNKGIHKLNPAYNKGFLMIDVMMAMFLMCSFLPLIMFQLVALSNLMVTCNSINYVTTSVMAMVNQPVLWTTFIMEESAAQLSSYIFNEFNIYTCEFMNWSISWAL